MLAERINLARAKRFRQARLTQRIRETARVDDGPAGEVKVLVSVNISTGMGGIFLYAGTAEGLKRSADCF